MLQEHFDKLANGVVGGLRQANNHEDFMGINTRPFMERDRGEQIAWMSDLKRLITEWWSATRMRVKENRAGFRVEFSLGGEIHNIVVKGDPSRRVEVDVNGTGTSFKPEDSLYDIILWINKYVMGNLRFASHKRALDLRKFMVKQLRKSRALFEDAKTKADVQKAVFHARAALDSAEELGAQGPELDIYTRNLEMMTTRFRVLYQKMGRIPGMTKFRKEVSVPDVVQAVLSEEAEADLRILGPKRFATSKTASWKDAFEAWEEDPSDENTAELSDYGINMFRDEAAKMGYDHSDFAAIFKEEALLIKRLGLKPTMDGVRKYMRARRVGQTYRMTRRMRVGLFMQFVAKGVITAFGVRNVV
jgi:hypothetical protein